MDSPLWVYLLGLAGMGIYGSRILIQWYMSEKNISPNSTLIRFDAVLIDGDEITHIENAWKA